MAEKPRESIVPVAPDLLRDACQIHGLYDGPKCPVCVALEAVAREAKR